MIRSIETPIFSFGDDNEFQQRLDKFNRRPIERIRTIPWNVFSTPRSCWSFLKHLAVSITGLFLRHYISVTVLNLSISFFIAAIVVLSGNESIVTMAYSLSFFVTSVVSLVSKKGSVAYELKRTELYEQKRTELSERQKLLEQSNRQNRQEAGQPSGYGSKEETQPLQRDVEYVMEPRPDLHRSNSYTLLNYDDDCAGSSHAPDPFPPGEYIYSSSEPSHPPECTGLFTTNVEHGYDSDKPAQGPFEARISADAVKVFGPPLQVFGADSYRVMLHSSDEDLSCNEPVNVGAKHFDVPVEVHNSDSYTPINPRNDGCSSVEPTSVAHIGNAIAVGPDSYSALCMDDQFLEAPCLVNDAKDDEPDKTDEDC